MSAPSLCRTAWFAAAVFAVGTVAVPTSHLIFHAVPHDHRAGEIHYQSGPASHDHDDDHRHHPLAEHHRDGHHHDHQQPFDPRHGEGSLAHFSLALSDSAASTIVILPLLGLTASRPPAGHARSPVLTAHVSVQRFRGPPAVRG